MRINPRDPLLRDIQLVLEKDLRDGASLMHGPSRRSRRDDDTSLDGYCAVGSAAYFFLGGGEDAGLQPMQRNNEDGSSHWWIVKDSTTVIDVTLRRGDPRDYPYGDGRRKGFMMTGYQRPAQRAQRLMDLVTDLRSGR